MTSILKIVGVVMVVGVLCVGAVALATGFTWDANTASTSWLTETNWQLDDSYPQNANDNATIDAAGNLCTFDPGSALTINNLTLAGASPTKRKLHIKDGTLTAETFDLQDYAELDVDDDVTVNSRTTVSGNVWIDVADGVTFTAKEEAFNDDDGLFVDGTSTRLNLATGSTGIFKVYSILIDADAAGAQRALKLDGGTIDVHVNEIVHLKSDLDADNNRAKLWVSTGSIDMGANAKITLEGGATNARRAELDLDQDLALTDGGGWLAETKIFGHVTIDIAAGKTFKTETLSVTGLGGAGGPAVLTVIAGANAALFSHDLQN